MIYWLSILLKVVRLQCASSLLGGRFNDTTSFLSHTVPLRQAPSRPLILYLLSIISYIDWSFLSNQRVSSFFSGGFWLHFFFGSPPLNKFIRKNKIDARRARAEGGASGVVVVQPR